MPARWDTSEPNTATYRSTRTGSTCRIDGFSFLHQLSAELIQRISDAGGSLPTYAGVVASTEVPTFTDAGVASGAWSTPLLRALYAAAQGARAPQQFLAAIAADAAVGQISPDTLRTAIWLTTYSHGTRGADYVMDLGSPAEVELPADTVLPVFGMSILRPAVLADITCLVGPLPVTPATPMATIASVLPAPAWIALAGVAVLVVATVVVSRNIPQQPHERRRR